MATIETEIDWTECELVERIPGKVSGRPIIWGKRIFPEAIVNGYELGESVEDLREGFPALSTEQICRLIEFALQQREQLGSPTQGACGLPKI